MPIPRKRSEPERKLIYAEIRARDLEANIARRLRDWTAEHINIFLKQKNLKELDISISGIYSEKNKIIEPEEIMQKLEEEKQLWKSEK